MNTGKGDFNESLPLLLLGRRCHPIGGDHLRLLGPQQMLE
jgi:hypothetical protein